MSLFHPHSHRLYRPTLEVNASNLFPPSYHAQLQHPPLTQSPNRLSHVKESKFLSPSSAISTKSRSSFDNGESISFSHIHSFASRIHSIRPQSSRESRSSSPQKLHPKTEARLGSHFHFQLPVSTAPSLGSSPQDAPYHPPVPFRPPFAQQDPSNVNLLRGGGGGRRGGNRGNGRKPPACAECKKAHKGCDRNLPSCSRCTKHNYACTYPQTNLPPPLAPSFTTSSPAKESQTSSLSRKRGFQEDSTADVSISGLEIGDEERARKMSRIKRSEGHGGGGGDVMKWLGMGEEIGEDSRGEEEDVLTPLRRKKRFERVGREFRRVVSGVTGVRGVGEQMARAGTDMSNGDGEVEGENGVVDGDMKFIKEEDLDLDMRFNQGSVVGIDQDPKKDLDAAKPNKSAEKLGHGWTEDKMDPAMHLFQDVEGIMEDEMRWEQKATGWTKEAEMIVSGNGLFLEWPTVA